MSLKLNNVIEKNQFDKRNSSVNNINEKPKSDRRISSKVNPSLQKSDVKTSQES